MNTAQTWQTTSTGLDKTWQLAEQIGSKLKGGEVIELISDLGGGKTAFVQGLARGMGYDGTVHSPSFTLSNEYKTKQLTLHHFDFYRLSQPGILRDELAEILTDPGSVVAVEWAAIVEDVLPSKRLTVIITVTGETSRRLDMTYSDELRYLLPTKT